MKKYTPPRKEFFMLPNNIFDMPLDVYAFKIYAYLVCCAGSRGECWPSLQPIDYEDWGLCFEIFRLDPSGITINCSQPGVQQMRLLNAGVPILSRKDSDTLSLEQVQSLTEEGEVVPFTGNKQWTPSPDGFLTMEGTKELSFNFAQLYGQLPTKKALQNFDFGFQKSVSREKMLRLSNMTWVEQAYNICFLGGFCKRS